MICFLVLSEGYLSTLFQFVNINDMMLNIYVCMYSCDSESSVG